MTAKDELVTVSQMQEEADRLRRHLTPDRVRFAHLFIGRHRGNASACAREIGVSDLTGWNWRDRDDVRSYIAALMKVEAAKLSISRTRIVGEMASIAMADISEITGELLKAHEAALEAISDGSAITVPENEDGAEAAILDERGSPSSHGDRLALETVARLPARIGRVVKKVRFDTRIERIKIKDADGNIVEERAIPRAVISDLELFDKTRALDTLGNWFDLNQEGDPLGSEAGGDGPQRWTGNQIVAPIERTADETQKTVHDGSTE